MANKTGMAFDPEQVQELSSALKAIENLKAKIADSGQRKSSFLSRLKSIFSS